MKIRHSPSPWSIEEGGYVIRSANGLQIARVVMAEEVARSDNDINSPFVFMFEGNGFLMAAAPNLYAALSRIVALAADWDANKLGSVDIQRKRWKRMAEIARDALEGVASEH